jgi:uncharacterized protein YdeI (YjbR/CyaY-like superfamily)
MNPHVDTYLLDGCGRCDYYQTPQCKVHFWTEELVYLRKIVLDCGLVEEYKWSQPCYTVDGKNILIMTAFKEYAALAFFKGALLKDPQEILITPGRSSQAARQFRFTSVEEILEVEPFIKSYIREAVELEKTGKKVPFKKDPEPWPEELVQAFTDDPTLQAAFEGLTPGRQRGYILHFSQPKQSKTRIARIEKWTPKILQGKGMQDDYRSGKK